MSLILGLQKSNRLLLRNCPGSASCVVIFGWNDITPGWKCWLVSSRGSQPWLYIKNHLGSCFHGPHPGSTLRQLNLNLWGYFYFLNLPSDSHVQARLKITGVVGSNHKPMDSNSWSWLIAQQYCWGALLDCIPISGVLIQPVHNVHILYTKSKCLHVWSLLVPRGTTGFLSFLDEKIRQRSELTCSCCG